MDGALSLIGKWKFPGERFISEKNIIIKHTNLLGNVYFANYIEWQGEVRENFFLTHPSAKEFLSRNPNLIMLTYALYQRFYGSAFLFDKLRIELTTKDIQKCSVVIIFRFFNQKENKLIGKGWQKICFSDVQKKQICPVPQIFLDLAEPIMEK